MPVDTGDVLKKPCSVDEAFAYCAALTEAHYENFPVASLFLPQEKRPYIQSVYAFSRTADDFADERSRTVEERLALLDDWEQKLSGCYEGKAEHPVFIALSETVRRHAIPVELMKDLLAAFRQDVVQSRYRTFDELLGYCRRSANPVGRIVLLIFGHAEERLFGLSDDVCTALQLANFWQDVDLDRAKDRLYIPLEDFHTYGYSLQKWEAGVADDSFRQMMSFETGRTRDLFYRGAELPAAVNKELQIELKLVWLGGMAILKKIDKSRYDVFRHRPKLSAYDKAMIFVRGFFLNDLTRFGKKKKPWDLT